MSEKFLLLPVLLPALAALMIPAINFTDRKARNIFIECAVLLNTLVIALLVIYPPSGTLILFRMSERAAFALKLDGLGMVFAVLIAALWPLTAL